MGKDRSDRSPIVALAGKLAGFLYAILRDGTVFDPKKLAKTTVKAERAA